MILEGVIVSGNRIFAEPQKTMALGKAWQSTFNAKPFQPELSKLYLDDLGDIGSYSHIAPPDYWLFQKFFEPIVDACYKVKPFGESYKTSYWLALLQKVIYLSCKTQ